MYIYLLDGLGHGACHFTTESPAASLHYLFRMFLRCGNMSIWTRTLATVLAMSLVVTTAAQNASDTEFNKKRTISIGIVSISTPCTPYLQANTNPHDRIQVIFPGFEPLDVFGSLDILVSVGHLPPTCATSLTKTPLKMSSIYKMTLSLIASSAGPVSMGIPRHQMEPNMPPMDLGHMLRPTILATHSFLDAPALDVLLIPGGVGNVVLEQHNDTSVEDFVKLRYDQVDYMMSVCTGAVSLAKSGVLDGKRATTNKFAWASATTYGKGVKWVPTARWVVDGKVWTSSGVSAGEYYARVKCCGRVKANDGDGQELI